MTRAQLIMFVAALPESAHITVGVHQGGIAALAAAEALGGTATWQTTDGRRYEVVRVDTEHNALRVFSDGEERARSEGAAEFASWSVP